MNRRFFNRIPSLLIVGCLSFIFILSPVVYLMHGTVNSPDERATELFATSWAERRELKIPVSIQQPESYPLFARSTQPHGQELVPSGFVGQPIFFGSLIGVFGAQSIFYITILLTALAAIAWWFIMCQIFGRPVADYSFLFFLFHPAVLYYSARGLFPNMAMLDLLIMSIASGWYVWNIRTHARENLQKCLMVSLCIAATVGAIAFRPPEALMVYAWICIAMLIFGSRAVLKFACMIVAMLMVLAGIFWFARSSGNFAGSYSFVHITSLTQVLFPFGIHIALVWHTAIRFIVKLFSPWVLVSSTGLLVWLWRLYKYKEFDRAVAGYVCVIVPVSFWLFIVYGSWSISDNPADASAVTLGSSYVRYWLPHLIFRMPFAAYLIHLIIVHWKGFRRWMLVAALSLSVIGGVWRASDGVDGLIAVVQSVREAGIIRTEVLERLPKGSVLAVRAWDKIFVGYVPVLQPFPRDVRTLSAARELLLRGGVPVWAFIETLAEVDERWLRDNKIFAKKIAPYGVHTLYELQLWNVAQ